MSLDRLLWCVIEDCFKMWMPHPKQKRRKRKWTRNSNVTVKSNLANVVAAKLDRALVKRSSRRSTNKPRP